MPCSPSRDLPTPGIESRSPALQEDFLPSDPPGKSIYIIETQLFFIGNKVFFFLGLVMILLPGNNLILLRFAFKLCQVGQEQPSEQN